MQPARVTVFLHNTMNISLNEKIHGFLAGTAIGDALGLGTEFMVKEEVKRRYPFGLRCYADIIRDAHRRQWKQGEWTNDTEMVLMLADSIATCRGIDHADYARRLKEWYLSEPTDVVSNVRWVLSQEDYLLNPRAVCRRVWTNMSMNDASNESLGRAAMIGLWKGDIDKQAVENCLLTHCDTRCACSSAIAAKMAHSLMWEDKEAELEELTAIAEEIDKSVVPYLRIAKNGDIGDLDLDDSNSWWHARKSLGSALWALWHCSSPEEILYTLVDEGGDADTNASLGLSLAGLKYGMSKMPRREWEELLRKEDVTATADRLCDVMYEVFLSDSGNQASFRN